MFRTRRLAKAKAKQSESSVAPIESEFEDARVDSFEESRDELNPFERFLSDASTVFSGAVTEAASMTEDVKSIISADLDEEEDDYDDEEDKDKDEDKDEQEEKKTAKSTRGSKSKKDKSRNVMKVKGSPSTLAKEIKKLDKLERQVEKAEKDILKAIEKTEKEIDKAELEQEKTRKKIKGLTRKFELEKFMRRDDEEFEDESVKEVLKDGAEGLHEAGESVVGYLPRLVGSVNRTATESIFPHNPHDADDADYE